MIRISYSRVQSYLKCPYQHYLRYYEGLRLKKPIRPLYFGSDFHKLLELRGRKQELALAKEEISDKYYDMKPQWQAELGDNYVEDLFTIFGDYNRVYKDAILPTKTEQPFEVKIGRYRGEPVYFIGIIDELYELDDKSIKIGEHKTFNRKPSLSTLTLNTQKCLYAKAAQYIYGILPHGVIWDYIKSTPAKSPVWLEKSGRFSTAKSQDVTNYSWLRACKEHGITDKDIIRQGKQYKGNLPNFFFRVEQDFLPQMVDTVWESFVYTCKDITKQGSTNKTRNFTRDCEYCSYYAICHSECTGGNTKNLIDKDYEVKERS